MSAAEEVVLVADLESRKTEPEPTPVFADPRCNLPGRQKLEEARRDPAVDTMSLRNRNRGEIPSELGWLIDKLDDLEKRMEGAERPSGTQYYGAVRTLEATVAELADLVANMEDRMDVWFATTAPGLISAAVTSQVSSALAAAFAGNVGIGGSLYVAGNVDMPGVRGRDITAVGSRTVVWVGGSGEMGHT